MAHWTSDQVAQLQQLWEEGHSTAEIGRRMGLSKNAIVSKARRLNLPPRPSPIRSASTPSSPKPPKAGESEGDGGVATGVWVPIASLVVSTVPQAVAVVAGSEPVGRHELLSLLSCIGDRVSDRGCCWPIGEPGTPEFRFCGVERVGGRSPYCPEHHAIAYVPLRVRAGRSDKGDEEQEVAD